MRASWFGRSSLAALWLVAGCDGPATSDSKPTQSSPAKVADAEPSGSKAADKAAAPTPSKGDAPDAKSTPKATDADAQPPPVPAAKVLEPAPAERPNLLSIAAGTLITSASIDGAAAAGKAVRVIDGSTSKVTITPDGKGPAEFVFELPGPTTFDTFVIPGIVEAPGNATFFKSIEISGSVTDATTGFEVLLAAELSPTETDGTTATLATTATKPARWLKVVLNDGRLIEHPTGKTNLEFTELIGYGEQPEVALSDKFTGVWDFRFAEGADKLGPLLELKQNGSTVVGCFQDTELAGTVIGSVARMTGIDRKRGDRPSAYLFGVTSGGELQGLESTNGGVFRARVGPVAPAGSTTPCSSAPPASLTCDSTFYLNFDVNSATIRPDSAAVLVDVAAGLKGHAGPITIEGHTSTEGSDADNLALSQRRAQAVVDDLVGRGFDGSTLTAAGKGETQPLVNDKDDEAARALNRRVAIRCP